MTPPRITQNFALILLAGSLTACGGGSGSSSDNSETIDDLAITFDSTPEESTDLRYAQFEFSASNAAGYECALNNEGFETCQSPHFEESISTGNNQLSVRAIAEDGAHGDVETIQWNVLDVVISGHDDLVATNVSPSPVAENSWRGIFRINCDFSHSSYDDPIVFPDQNDAAHLHRFYGNTEVDESTTMASLYTTGESSCQGNLLNLSSYWVPALLAPVYDQITGNRELDENGDPAWQVVPAVVGNDDEAHEVFYYSAGVDDLEAIQPIPPGLRMIAGDSSTQPGEEQDTAIARWHCQTWESDDATNPQFSATIPECQEPDRVRMDLFFPSCWDGENLDSADHRSHMAYPINDGGPEGTHCPDSHPVPLVRVSYHYAFGVLPEYTHPYEKSSQGWRLAADMYEVTEEQAGGLSLHGDWFNAWHPSVMETILENCIQQGLDCHDGNLANGLRLSGTREGTQEEPAIMNGGMGY
ncbi:DUF1996 domain-containing protein [Marinobacter sp. CHS3-4]|uniref:DUF1996 domain-containing protein n=1 Tax=Marinobacter sp. CHS3-4 TaxID=3045174 RepID=UPI0024B5F6C7|nr:DUF1996 domain-containing protein [Marinobacter sp. CHS3-4]MDI9244634.1 DUF1996 domain-containing protein [Marinobacter sp. CHS3-4]